MGSADSPVQRAFNIASSSVILVIFLIVGLISATIACLPILLLLKIASILYSFGSSPHEDDVDSSVHPYSPSSDIDGNSFIERSLLSLMGSHSCTNEWDFTQTDSEKQRSNLHIKLSLGIIEKMNFFRADRQESSSWNEGIGIVLLYMTCRRYTPSRINLDMLHKIQPQRKTMIFWWNNDESPTVQNEYVASACRLCL